MPESIAALIVAAGAGTRFGTQLPKVYVDLCGQPMLKWSLKAYDAVEAISRICVVAASPYMQKAREVCDSAIHSASWDVTAGDDRRQESVLNGLLHLKKDPPDIVCIHDGARPLVTPGIIESSIAVSREHHAAVACIPVTNTIKSVHPDGAVDETLDRSRLRTIQTPQTFLFDLVLKAHQRAVEEGWTVTDDASVVEAMGHPVMASEGSPENIKITTPQDLPYAEWLMRRRNPDMRTPAPRVGHGWDLHRVAVGRPLKLCGVAVECERGLDGHSDADVALHAVTDAILGAAGMGDIGQHFPDTDPTYEGADSGELLSEVLEMVHDSGMAVGNVDVTIIAAAPKIAPYREQMRARLAELCRIKQECANVKAKTSEGLGPVGEGRAISAHAVVTLVETTKYTNSRADDCDE